MTVDRLITFADPDDERRVLVEAAGPDVHSGADSLLRLWVSVNDNRVPSIVWTSSASPHEVPGATGTGQPRLAVAEAFLSRVLKDGPLRATRVAQLARSAGIAMPTLRRAKRRLGVTSDKAGALRGPQRWFWRLSEDDHT